MKGYPMKRVKRKNAHATVTVTDPHGGGNTVKVRRIHDPRGGMEDYREATNARQRKVMVARAAAIQQLRKDGNEVDDKITDKELENLSETFRKVNAEHGTANKKADLEERTKLAASLVAHWKGPGFDVLPSPENGTFTIEDVHAAFFSDDDDLVDTIPNFVAIDEGGNVVEIVQPDDDRVPSAVAFLEMARDEFEKEKAQMLKKRQEALANVETSDDDDGPAAEIAAASILESFAGYKEELDKLTKKSEADLDDNLRALGLARHRYGGLTFREGNVSWIIDAAKDAEEAYRRSMGFLSST